VLWIDDRLFDGELEKLMKSDLFDKQGLVLVEEVGCMVWLSVGSLFGG